MYDVIRPAPLILSARIKRPLAFALVAFALAFAVSVLPRLAQVNVGLFNELCEAMQGLAPSSAQLHRIVVQPNFGCLGIWLVSMLSLFAGYRCGPSTRFIFTGQLVALSLIIQWFGWSLFGCAGEPLTYCIAIAMSCNAGALIRSRESEQDKVRATQWHLKLRNQELLESRLFMIKQDELERRLLAADLHDQVLFDLRSVQRKFEEFTRTGNSEDSTAAIQLLQSSMRDIRKVMDDLCPSILDSCGLNAAIEDLLDNVSDTAGIDVRFDDGKVDLTVLSDVERLLLFRLTQEALNNVAKHSQASLVKVKLKVDDDHLHLSITDNGVGTSAAGKSASSRGMYYMRLRASLIGATINWFDAEPRGTEVLIRLKMREVSPETKADTALIARG